MPYIDIADKTTLDKIYNMLATEPVYGFIEHNAILAPGSRIEYIGLNKDYSPLVRNKTNGSIALNSWADFPLLKANKPYMVRADGTPDYVLDQDDYTKKEDGTASDVANTSYNGGAFSWLMKIYKSETMVGDDRVVKFSLTAKDGYEPIGFIDSSGHELEGVWLPMFYGSVVSEKMRSISGTQPCRNLTTAQEKTAIDKVGARAKFFGGQIVETVIDLLIMFSKTTNLQEAYGYGNCSGYNESQAPTYGVKANAVVGGGQFYGTDDQQSLNKIFHSIALGSYQQWMRDPYEVVVNGRVKVSKNYAYDVTGAAYNDAGIETDGSGWAWPSRYRTVHGYGSVPVAPYIGSSSTGGCDGTYISSSQSQIVAVCLRFGYCGHGLSCGFRCRDWGDVSGNAYWSFGAAVLLLPPVGVAA